FNDEIINLTTIPWKLIFLSLPVWAIVICNFCRSWTFFLLLGNQLTYMSDVLHLEIHSGGLIGSLPHILMSIVVLSSGQIADHLRSTGKMSTTAVRKLFNSLEWIYKPYPNVLMVLFVPATLCAFLPSLESLHPNKTKYRSLEVG
uniref:Uncharacterized protein n=1 Tax=Parascaris equorum TaxID=6256 RepID=A0A914RIA4_PAREQ